MAARVNYALFQLPERLPTRIDELVVQRLALPSPPAARVLFETPHIRNVIHPPGCRGRMVRELEQRQMFCVSGRGGTPNGAERAAFRRVGPRAGAFVVKLDMAGAVCSSNDTDVLGADQPGPQNDPADGLVRSRKHHVDERGRSVASRA
jgi:hypothetical protein